MQEKWGNKGFNIVAVTSEDSSKIDGWLKGDKGKPVNYFIGICPDKTVKADYEIKAWPTNYLVGPDGKIERLSASSFSDSEIEGFVSTLAPRVVGRAVEKGVKKAADLFDKGELGASQKELEKILDPANADKHDEKAIEDAKFVASLIQRNVDVSTKRLDVMETEKDYLTMQVQVEAWKKKFKGLPFEDVLKEKEKHLKSREVKKEIASLNAFEKHKAAWSKANDKAKEGMKPAIEKFIKDNEGTKGAEKARAMIG